MLKLSDDLIFTISFFLSDPHHFELTCSRIRNVIVTSWKERFQQQILTLQSTTTTLNDNDGFICFISPNEYLQKLLLKQQKHKTDLHSCYKIAFYYTKWLRDFKLAHDKEFLLLNENPLNDLIIGSYKYSNYNKYANLFLQKEKYPNNLLVNGLNCKVHFDENVLKELEAVEEDKKRRIKQQQQTSRNIGWKNMCLWICLCFFCCWGRRK